MVADEIECPDCDGWGFRGAYNCPYCDGNGWRPMTGDELEAAAEQQAEDAMSEPPITMAESHRFAWDEKQALRR